MQVAKHIEKSIVPPQAAKLEGETNVKVPSENIKLSPSAISFQNKKTGSISRVPGLPDLPVNMPGCQNPNQAPFQQTSLDRVRESTQRFRESLMFSFPEVVREQAVSSLTLLIRFDSFNQDESYILMQASRIITAKGLPA